MKKEKRKALHKKGSSSYFRARFFLPILSALLLFTCIHPTYLFITNFIFLIPLLFYLKEAKSYKDAIKGGIMFGAVLYLTIFQWLRSLFSVSIPLALAFYLLIIAYFTLFAIVFVVLSYWFARRLRLRFFLFMPFLWVCMEYIRTFGPFRLTVDHAAYCMAFYPPLIQFIDISGPYGIAFWLVLINTLIFESIVMLRERRNWIKSSVAAALIIFLPIAYSLYRWNTLSFKSSLKISMIQPNVPLEHEIKRGHEEEIMKRCLSMSADAVKEKPDLIIWPETSFPYPLIYRIGKGFEDPIFRVTKLAAETGVPFLIGAKYFRVVSREEFDVYNAALLIDANGNIRDFYEKMYLVPITEKVPFKEVLGIKRMANQGFLSLLGGFTSGKEFTIFKIRWGLGSLAEKKSLIEESARNLYYGDEERGVEYLTNEIRFGALICYEGLFPELARTFKKKGADFLICITNDAWFKRTVASYWHASALRMRAIENRMPVARCANTGISCFFDPLGRMHQQSEIFTQTIVTGVLAEGASGTTIYTRYGDAIAYLSCAWILILLFAAPIVKRKTRS